MLLHQRKRIILTTIVSSGLFLAVAMYPFSAMAATTSPSSTGVGTISVTGTAKTKVVPDAVQISLGVDTTNKSAIIAETQNNTLMNKIMKSLGAIGVPRSNIQTEQFDFQPNYSNNQSQIIGFTVSNTLTITIRKISLTGKIVDKLVADGANQINNINYTESNASKIQQSLEAAAIANARAQASQIAKELGVTITGVKSVDATSNNITPVYYGNTMNNTMVAAAVPFSPGSQTISSSVSVVYTIRNK